MLSIYGATGRIGSYYSKLFKSIAIPRNTEKPLSSRVLYFISTTDNFNVFTNPTIDVETNLLELVKRLHKCRLHGLSEFNFVSSWFVYGKRYDKCLETDYCFPSGLYPVTKLAAENIVIDYCNQFNIKWRILRLGNVYGGSDKGSDKRNALHKFVQDIKENKDIKIFKNVGRDFIHILDVCRGIYTVVEHGEHNSIYNIGTGSKFMMSSMLSEALKLTKSSSQITCIDPPPDYNQAVSTYLDTSKLKKLGFKPFIHPLQGIKDLCCDQKFCTPDLILMDPKLKQLLKI